jgi:hypothetical protein
MSGTIHMPCRSKSVICTYTGLVTRPRARSRIRSSAGRKCVQTIASGANAAIAFRSFSVLSRSIARRTRANGALGGVLSMMR